MLLKCTDCSNSSGTVEKDGVLYECMCATLRRIGSKVPPYIRKAQVQKPHLSIPIIRKSRNHYYVLSSWEDMKAVIKLVMLLNPNRFIRITSDREIRDIYVGSKSRQSLGNETESEVINSLEQLMDHPYIVIIKVNELYYKNKAASGALEEAISYRLERDKPVWVFCDRSRPFGKGSFSWSSSVEELLDTGFDYVDIPVINAPGLNEGISPHKNKLDLTPVEEDDDTTPDVSSSSLVRKKAPKKSKIFQTTGPDDENSDTKDMFDDPVYDRAEKKSPLAQYGSGVDSGYKKKKSTFGNKF